MYKCMCIYMFNIFFGNRDITNSWTKANVDVDGKHLRQIKETDIQQCVPIETEFWLVADEESAVKLLT